MHIIYIATQQFLAKIQTVKDKTTRRILKQLYRLFVYNKFEELAPTIISSSALTSAHYQKIQTIKEHLYNRLRPHGLILAEGIPFKDQFLISALSDRNARGTQTMYDWAKDFGALNQDGPQPHPKIVNDWIPVRDGMGGDDLRVLLAKQKVKL